MNKEMETYYLYGRMLGVLNHVDKKFPPEYNVLFLQSPFRRFPEFYKKVFPKLQQPIHQWDERRLEILIDFVDVETQISLPETPSFDAQNMMNLGLNHEREFLYQTGKREERIREGIKKGREAAGLTQAQLAEQAGLKGGSNSISRYELGEVVPSEKALQRIRRVIGYQYI